MFHNGGVCMFHNGGVFWDKGVVCVLDAMLQFCVVY